MKSKFALSFGLALIAVGIINLFLETSNIILFGISLSSFIFSLISILFTTKLDAKKYEMIYILPLMILLVFFCYGNDLMNIKVIKLMVNSRLTSALTFISFGISFANEYIIERALKLTEKLRHLSLVIEMKDYTQLIQNVIIEYQTELINENIITDKASKNFLNNIEKLYREKEKKARIENNLLSLENDSYTIDDFDEAYTKETEILNSKSISKK